MAEIEITGIRKDNGNHYNPHEAATHYRWSQKSENKGAITPREIVVGWLEGSLAFEVKAFVKDNTGKVDCFVNKSPAGTKFLQTRADNRWSDNLLNLPEC